MKHERNGNSGEKIIISGTKNPAIENSSIDRSPRGFFNNAIAIGMIKINSPPSTSIPVERCEMITSIDSEKFG